MDKLSKTLVIIGSSVMILGACMVIGAKYGANTAWAVWLLAEGIHLPVCNLIIRL